MSTPLSASTSEDEGERDIARVPSSESPTAAEDRFEAQKRLLSPQLRQSLCFIRKGLRNGGRVLVHCSQGVNRSPTVVVAYLVCCEGYSLKDAFRLVEEARPQTCLHERYFSALQRLEMRWYSLDRPSLSEEGKGPNLQEMLRMMAQQTPKNSHQDEEISSTAPVHDEELGTTRVRSETGGHLERTRKHASPRRSRVASDSSPSPILGQDAWKDVSWDEDGSHLPPGVVVVGERTAAGMALADGLLGALGDEEGGRGD